MERNDWLRHLAWFTAEFRDSDKPFKEAFEEYFGSGIDELFEATDELFFDCAEIEAEDKNLTCGKCHSKLNYLGRSWLGADRENDMFHCPDCGEYHKESYVGNFPFFSAGRVFPSEKYHTSCQSMNETSPKEG